jgi:hypothetical protein
MRLLAEDITNTGLDFEEGGAGIRVADNQISLLSITPGCKEG